MPRRTFDSRWAQGGAQSDPGDIKTELGWVAEKPPYQQENWVQARQDDMLAHIEEQGVPDWNVGTDYLEGALAMGSDRAVYRAVQANTGVNPTTDAGSNWLLLVRTATESNPGVVQLASPSEVLFGLDGTKAISPLNLANRQALTTRTGLVELATNAETQALADATRAVTPGGLGSMLAGESQLGIIRLASLLQVAALADSDRAVTPAGLGSLFSFQTQASPFQVAIGLPHNVMVQFGRVDAPVGSFITVNFLVDFVDADSFTAFAIPSSDASSFTTRAADSGRTDGTVEFRLSGVPSSLDWIAVGLVP